MPRNLCYFSAKVYKVEAKDMLALQYDVYHSDDCQSPIETFYIIVWVDITERLGDYSNVTSLRLH